MCQGDDDRGTGPWRSKGDAVGKDWAAGWGTLTLINAGLAQGKGRSGLLWWLASLVLGPIATFLIVVLPAAPVAP
jgi:hypothetical protein